MLDYIAGLRVIVVPEPVLPHWVTPKRVPSKRAGRKGSRRQWKAKQRSHFVHPVVSLERGQIMKTADSMFIRAADYRELKRRLEAQ